MTVDDRLYGIPESFKAVVFWYNKSLLANPPTTTDDLISIMQAGTPVSITYGCYHQWGFYSAFGGRIFDESWRVVADQGGVTEAIAYLDELYQISRRNGWPTNDGDGLGPFIDGSVAAITNGNWAMGEYRNALGSKLAVAPLPAGPEGPASPMLGVDGFYFNPNSQNLETAVKAALYLTGQRAQAIMVNEAGHVPVNTTVTISDPIIKSLAAAFKDGYVRPQVPQLGSYWTNFCNTAEVFEGGMLPADWVQSATENANR
jgi:arabinogalactan oligomer/maltooligosaccharide transport system substrate-binding protein